MENIEHIRTLLDKFYEGLTTIEEEKEIREFFLAGEVPPDLQPERQFFISMKDASEGIVAPAGLDDRIMSSIAREANKEQKTRRLTWYSLSGLAAGLAIILAVYFTVLKQQPQRIADSGTFEDPKEAYEETMKVLSYVSNKWNDGTKELQNLKQINKTMEAISPIQKINSANKQLQLLGNLEKVGEL